MKTIALASCACLLVACGGSTGKGAASAATVAGAPAAVAMLESRSGSAVTGTVELYDAGDTGTRVVVRVANAAPGKHGLHLHENGDCAALDASSAGGHFNPEHAAHGAPEATGHHAGDLGNLEVGADGTGKLELTTKDLTLGDGPHGVAGRAVIFHEKQDDLASQPAGAAGARVACGVIKAASN